MRRKEQEKIELGRDKLACTFYVPWAHY